MIIKQEIAINSLVGICGKVYRCEEYFNNFDECELDRTTSCDCCDFQDNDYIDTSDCPVLCDARVRSDNKDVVFIIAESITR